MATRTRRTLEPRWVSWYCAKAYGDFPVRLRCPLGPIPPELIQLHGEAKARRIHRPWRPEVDALVLLPGQIVLIEAKIQKYMDGLSKLPVYKSLIPVTPELREYRDLPVRMILLLPTRIAWVVAAAERMGVDVAYDAPDFILKVWAERDKYWTKPYLEKREARKKILGELGYD